MSTDDPTGAVRSINCTNCGAGLPVLGGGRVITQVCGYCGASLDASDAFRVLQIFDGQERPRTPFRLGMQAEIDGVTFTIIGTLGQQETWHGKTWDWADHQLFSPTHGYAWLTIEDGHCVLTRKRRDGPMDCFVTTRQVEAAEQRPRVHWNDRSWRYYETSTWETTFVEGEFNWRPERGARGTSVTLMTNAPQDGILIFVDPHGQREREVEHSRYWPEAAQAFGVDNPPRAHGRHPIQPIERKGRWVMPLWFVAMAAAALALAVVVLGIEPARVTLHDAPATELPSELSFAVSDTTRPARLELYQRLSNDFAGYEVTLRTPAGTLLAETYREISYYSGGSGEDAWSEGSRSQMLNFMPPEVGTYALTIAPDSTTSTRASLRVTLQEGRRGAGWLVWAAIGFAACAVAAMVFAFSANVARWKGSDWSEED